MTTVYCTAYGCKHNKPHEEDCGTCERGYIILDGRVDWVFEGCPDYEAEGDE